MAEDSYEYQPQGQFLLERDFLSNPLMTTIKLARFKFPAKMIQPDDDVLDLGCGSGLSTYFYAKNTRGKVTGIDLNPQLKEHSASFQADNLSYVNTDIASPADAIAYSKFDVIISVDVIEHFPREVGIQVMNDYYQRLKPGGMLIIGTPSRLSGAYRSEGSKKVHLYEYDPDELLEIMRAFSPRVLQFSMNDEVIHTGFNKMAWFIFNLAYKG